VSLEPDRESFSLLQRNIELNKCSKVHALNLAAGAKEETRPLYAPVDDGYGYSLMRKGVDRGYVKVMPLDKAVLPFIGDSPVELTKIDVEGAELEVLNGATAILNRSKHLMIEIWPDNWNQVRRVLEGRFKRVSIGRRWSPTHEVNVFLKRTWNRNDEDSAPRPLFSSGESRIMNRCRILCFRTTTRIFRLALSLSWVG
jgi:FkbM family methyltransferase